MQLFPLFSVVVTVAALFSFVNHRFLRLPTTIGVMTLALTVSLALLMANALGAPVHRLALALFERVRFQETVLNAMLAFLLFAGALHVDLRALWGERVTVGLLATIGVLVSTVIVAALSLLSTRAFGLRLGLMEALLFGALISPTDPIAVIGMLRAAQAPKRLEVQIAGESLFNDGVGVVLFFVLVGIATGHAVGAAEIGLLLAREVAGGLGLGLLFGWIAFRMLRAVDNYQLEVLITVALAMGLYSLAAHLDSSGPLAVVVAGLVIGNPGRAKAMSPRTIEHVDSFWEMVDEILNVALFTLIGFEVLAIPFGWRILAVGLTAIPIVLLARLVSVGGTVATLAHRKTFPPHAVRILTWGGLRGGLAVALASALDDRIGARSLILAMTYVVVVFSILVQGLTFRRLLPPAA